MFNMIMPFRSIKHTLILLCICIAALSSIQCGGSREERGFSSDSTVTVAYSVGGKETLLSAFDDEARFLVFLPLVSYSENGDPVGRLAKTWEYSPDYREVTYHLRNDVRWHDGVPVTAHDVKFTLELLSHPEILEISPGAIESATVIDDTTITVRGTGWPPPGDDGILWWTVYFPKHLLESLDPSKFYEWEFWKRPVGNGPYRFLRYVPETGMAFEANPDYYRGKPKIERVMLKFVGGAGLSELLSGNVDVIAFANPVHIPRLAEDLRFRLYYQNWDGECAAIYWQNDHPLLGDSRVRLALTQAINRRELLQILNLPEDLPLFDGIYTSRQFRRGQLPKQLPYDPARAKRLFETAGWRDTNGDGVLDRDRQVFRFTALVNTAWGQYERIAVYIQDQFRRMGVRMEIQTMDQSALYKRLESGDFEAGFVAMRYSFFLHGLFKRWQIGYKNVKVVELIHRLSLTSDPDAVDNIYQRLSEIFRKDMPVTFLYPSVGFYFVHRRIQGLSSPWRADAVGNMEHLWIEEE